MALWVDVARIAIGLNLILLAALESVWIRNHLQVRSKQTLGLAAFGGFLFVENGFALYFYLFHPVLRVWVTAVPTIAQIAMTTLRVLELGALVFLTWITWD